MIGPYSLGPSDTSYLSAISIVSGIAGNVVFLKALKRTNEYKKLTFVGIVGGIGSVIILIFLL